MSRGVATISVIAIVLVAIASGPLVSSIDLTAERTDVVEYGTGSVTVSNVTIPDDGFTLQKGSYGSAAYFLETPDVRATVDSVEGTPRLIYKLRIPGQNHVVLKTTFLRNDVSGRIALEGPEDTFRPSAVNQTAYRAEVLVLVRSGMESRVLATKNVTIEVTQ